MVTLKLVTVFEQVKRNIIQYNKELKENKMDIRPNSIQQWYYIMELDMFGPSRYIGYQDVDIRKYNNCDNLDGGKTTYALKEWFNLSEDPILFEKIAGKLIDYLAQFDLDVRRNADNLPSFKLNLLKEDIPKLEQLYLSEKTETEQTICQTCNKSFWKEPFYAHNERGPFCSQKCLPEETLDEYKAMDYVNYIEIYRELVDEYDRIEDVEMRDDLLGAISQVVDQIGEYFLKDAESEYEGFIVELYPKFEKLQEYTWNYYIDDTHLDIEEAVRINWAAFVEEGFTIGELKTLADEVASLLKAANPQFEIMYHQDFYIDHSSINIIFYERDNVSNETDRLLEEAYNKCFIFLDEYELEYDIETYLDKTLVAVCPKCTLYETLEDFSIDKEHNLFCCQNC